MSSSRLGDSTCIVRGVDVMTVISGVSGTESKWTSLGYIALIALVLRLLQLFLLLLLEGGTLILAWHRNFKFLWKKKSVAPQPQPQQSPLHPSPDSHPAPRIKKSSSVLLNLFGVGRGGSLIDHGEQSKTGNTVHFFDIGAERTAQVTTDSRAPSLVWRRVNAYRKLDGRRLLENVSGLAKSGHLLAIMGPSGAGKTTLIQAISNRASHVHAYGDVRYCGRALQEQELIYVPKTVEFNKVLTVQENIELVGCLRCKDLKALKARIEGVYHTLKLKDKLHLRCGDLSAGEVKRVGLCIALVVNPRILVLDEPTSGLDSNMAQMIVEQLLVLCRETAVSVVMTVHQPSTQLFNKLEDLMLLEGGRVAYFGPVQDAKRFFGALGYQCPAVFNPADFYMDLVYKKPFDELEVTWKDLYLSFNITGLIVAKDGEDDGRGKRNSENVLDITTTSALSRMINTKVRKPFQEVLRDMYYLGFYFFKNYNQDMRYYGARYVVVLIYVVFAGTLFRRIHADVDEVRKLAGAISVIVLLSVLSLVFSSNAMVEERQFAYELARNKIISPFSYCLTQFLISLPYNLLIGLLSQLIFHGLVFFNADASVFVYTALTLFLIVLFMEALFIVIVEVLRNSLLCLVSNVIVMAPLAYFTGYFVTVRDMPVGVSWIAYLVPTKVINSSLGRPSSVLLLHK